MKTTTKRISPTNKSFSLLRKRQRNIMTNTSRTLKYLRDLGYTAGMVERYLSFAHKRVDLFSVIDLIAIKPNEILGVQSCGQAFSEHKNKLLNEEGTKKWLEAGGGLWIIGWRKLKLKRGGKAIRWKPRIYQFSILDLPRKKKKLDIEKVSQIAEEVKNIMEKEKES